MPFRQGSGVMTTRGVRIESEQLMDRNSQQTVHLYPLKEELKVRQERVVTTIASPDPDRILEIASDVDATGKSYLEVRRLSWGKGVGWYCQQTLRLDPQETAVLKKTLQE